MEVLGEQENEARPHTHGVNVGRAPPPPPPPDDALAGSGPDPDPDNGRPNHHHSSKAIAAVRYLECLRNHAASVGGNILDGCREFMPSGDDGTLDSLRCAACNCHRNFHLKSTDDDARLLHLPPLPSRILLQPQKFPPPAAASHHFHFGTPVGAAAAQAQPMAVAFGGAESSSEDMNGLQPNAAGMAAAAAGGGSRKRFRTKFRAEQKEKMLEFAERMGWRIQNRNEAEIQKFCAEVGVRRQVFKVWMHNNKNSVKLKIKQQQQQQL